ncbi:alpha/beta hydrolase [Nonomuraea soli]|uniref:Acetyl esterase n=1 Tax=Nonomuraea soli TaxID=1032476 RepID=A0A7W0CIH7_9ACTN|nr:alpha/beta hydrolase [Nonomuraea soli]MBA2891766.1 acetyl esterase [Nonomuraea soli]
MAIDPALIAAVAELGVAPPEPSQEPAEYRERALAYEQAIYPALGLPAPEVPTREYTVDGELPVKVRLFYPREAQGRLPVSMFLFGGAWRQSGLHHPYPAALCALRAERANVVIAAVDYALAPENRFPAALEQAYRVLEWLVAEADTLGVDPERIALSGQSSGANLTAALTHVNRDRANHPVALQILEVPALDLTGGHLDFSAGPGSLEDFKLVVDTYLPPGVAPKDPYVSPLLATSFEGLPPALVITAEHDVLRGDGEAYVTALAAAGVPAAGIRMVGQTHESGMFEQVLLTARIGQAIVTDALRGLHD